MGRLSTRRPIGRDGVLGFIIGVVPFGVLGGITWWIARFIRAGGESAQHLNDDPHVG
jgi:CHASE3 domain sensor protein